MKTSPRYCMDSDFFNSFVMLPIDCNVRGVHQLKF